MSKILSPGIRVGWVVAPRPVLAKIALGKQSADLCSSSLTQYFVAAYFANGDWRDYIDVVRDRYRRRDASSWPRRAGRWRARRASRRAGGGLFIWVTLPEYIDTSDLLARALRENVAFVPGEAAFDDGRGHSSMRLNFSSSTEDQIREGVLRIGKIINEQVALYRSLTGEQRMPDRPHEVPADDASMAAVVSLPQRAQRPRKRSREL
jgi:2-aminoadipate transaminase